jgi:hypothetical protein
MQTENKITAMLKSDVKINVRLVGEDQSHTVNIQSVDAYFIHKDLRIKAEENKKHFKFLRRYPIEPCVNNLRSTICCLNNPGIYGYNTRPVGTCAPVYAGFGVAPFAKNHRFLQTGPDVVKAAVYYTADRSTVEIYFPAVLQKKAGEYDLVINARLYDSNYHFNNIRVVSVSYESIVTLTPTATGFPSGISDIEINGDSTIIPDDPDQPIEYDGNDRYLESAVLNRGDNGTEVLFDLANSDDDVTLNISELVDWYEGD